MDVKENIVQNIENKMLWDLDMEKEFENILTVKIKTLVEISICVQLCVILIRSIIV